MRLLVPRPTIDFLLFKSVFEITHAFKLIIEKGRIMDIFDVDIEQHDSLEMDMDALFAAIEGGGR